MRILIKQVTIQDSRSEFFGKRMDLLSENGQWIEIASSIQASADVVIEEKNASWSPSVVDLRVHHTLPGGEFREDWSSLQAAALQGGVLDMVLLPTGEPVAQTAESIQFIMQKGFHAMAPLTLDNKGENFTDLFDLHQSGATWFGHGAGSLQHVDLMAKCLQYLQNLPVTVVSRPDTVSLSLYGQIHEGLQSTLQGLKGIPVLAETLSIKRDLDLLRYVRSHDFGQVSSAFKLHFSCLSSAESVELIREAKAEGLPVTADVTVHQLVFTEASVADFDTNKKVFPPFRTEADLEALWNGIKTGVIDAVVSDHQPIEYESKAVEFDHASFGTIGLETLFMAFAQASNGRKIKHALDLISLKPAQLLGIQLPELKVGATCKGLVYTEEPQAPYTESMIKSKSKNSCFLGHTFAHQIRYVIQGDSLTQN
jgi:dihydroorotase